MPTIVGPMSALFQAQRSSQKFSKRIQYWFFNVRDGSQGKNRESKSPRRQCPVYEVQAKDREGEVKAGKHRELELELESEAKVR